jgi:hypothetical protein
LGGCCFFSIQPRRRKERTIHRWLRPAVPLYVGELSQLEGRLPANDFAALVLTTIFSLSTRNLTPRPPAAPTYASIDRSLVNLPVLGVPASLAFGYVVFGTEATRPWATDNKQLRLRLHDLRSGSLRLVSFSSRPAFGAHCSYSQWESNKTFKT